MKERLSQRVLSLEIPMTIEMSKRSRELAARGIDVISLSLGEPDFDTPDFVKDAAIEGVEKNFSHYMPVPGYVDLRQAIVKKFKRDNQLEYTPDQIIVSTGAKQSLTNIVLSLVEEGDEVIIPAPYWVSYYELVKYAGGTPVVISAGLDQAFKITPEQLEAAITPKTKALLYSSPNNPSGAMYSREELEALANVLRKYPDIFVISDEIYELINYGREHVSIASLEGMYDRTAVVNGLSKGFAMTGYRLGYMGAPLWLAKACEKIQSQFTSGTSSIAQRAAIAAVDADPSTVQYMVDAFEERKNKMVEWFKEIPQLDVEMPEGAFYIFAGCSRCFGKTVGQRKIENGSDLAMYLLEEGHVSSVPGEAFGLPGYIRFSYAASMQDLEKAAIRIKESLAKLQ